MFAQRLIPLSTKLAHCHANTIAACITRIGCMTSTNFITTTSLLSNNSTSCVPPASTAISEADYERKADQSLDNLSDYLDTFPEWLNCDDEFDINYAMGVITANVGQGKGIYVINKQTPNRQIWLSSPLSGPKRFDLVGDKWIYSHDGASLDSLLTKEFRELFKCDKIDFSHHL